MKYFTPDFFYWINVTPLFAQLLLEKQKGEILGVVIVESGWGSILPTVILANMMNGGPAARSGKLSIGDQIMSINKTSLVGLPLATCQGIIKVGRVMRLQDQELSPMSLWLWSIMTNPHTIRRLHTSEWELWLKTNTFIIQYSDYWSCTSKEKLIAAKILLAVLLFIFLY